MPTLFRTFLVAFCICFGVVVLASGLRIPAIVAQSGPELLVECVIAAMVGAVICARLTALLDAVLPPSLTADEVEFEFDIVNEEAEATQ